MLAPHLCIFHHTLSYCNDMFAAFFFFFWTLEEYILVFNFNSQLPVLTMTYSFGEWVDREGHVGNKKRNYFGK